MRLSNLLVSLLIVCSCFARISAQEQPTQVAAEGKLKQQMGDKGAESKFTLVHRYGFIQYYVATEDECDLRPFLGKQVQISGDAQKHPEMKHPLLVANRLSLTDGTVVYQSKHIAPSSDSSSKHPKTQQTSLQNGKQGRRVTSQPLPNLLVPNTDEAEVFAQASWSEEPSCAMPYQLQTEPSCQQVESCNSCSPNNGCNDCRCGEFFFRADYLAWKPRRRAFDVAIVDENADDAPEGPVQSLDWQWSSGVRVGVGYRNVYDWEYAVNYTYFRSENSLQIDAPAGGILWTTLTHADNVENATSVIADSELEYNVIDFELAKRIEWSRSLQGRVFLGGRYAMIDQTLNALYDGGDANMTLVSSPISFTGGGLRIGAEATQQFNPCWQFFGRASGALLVGQFDAALQETSDNGATVTANVTETWESVVPNLELAVGLSRDWCNWRLRFGYEMSYWGEMVDSPDFVDDVHEGKSVHRTSNLTLDGFFFQLSRDW